jgi:hypothetical protein
MIYVGPVTWCLTLFLGVLFPVCSSSCSQNRAFGVELRRGAPRVDKAQTLQLRKRTSALYLIENARIPATKVTRVKRRYDSDGLGRHIPVISRKIGRAVVF